MTFDLQAEIAQSIQATILMEPLLRFDPVSAAIMIGFVMSYADKSRPTIPALYRKYRSELERQNATHFRNRELPLLSMYLFRSSVESLNEDYVLAARHGWHAAERYRGHRRPHTRSAHQDNGSRTARTPHSPESRVAQAGAQSHA